MSRLDRPAADVPGIGRTRDGSRSNLRISLELESLPESVALVRSVIATVAEAGRLEGRLLDDLRTAVSEACNNVVLHAYPAAAGPLLFSLALGHDGVEAVVRDRGCGMGHVSLDSRGLGMGVVVISALADQAEFKSDPGTGTEVRMRFRRPAPVPDRLSRLNLGVWTLSGSQAAGVHPARSG